MRRIVLSLLALTMVALAAAWPLWADDKAKPTAPAVGIPKRTLWTTSKIKGSPEPPPPYRSEVAFPKLPAFASPLDLAAVPGSDRLAVAERFGKIYTFVNNPQTDKADLALDLKKTVYAVAFHPQFAKNGYLYVTYVLDPDKPSPLGTRVSRFTVKPDAGWKADPLSEKVLIEWPSGGHNGGCLQFGPDGYLYIVTGDASGIADELQTGQDLSDLPGSILRIDVDKPDEGKAYGIPKDNPFVKLKDARPEVYAYGLRQPWRMSFDRKTGDLWAGEVGQDLWEMVLKVEKGGNYGWSVTEGLHPFRPERKKGPTPILPPVIEHPHTEARSVTGGHVYHGTRLKELEGAYVYGDFDTGKVWALRFDGKKVTWKQELARTQQRIVSWGQDAAGEIYILDFMGGRIYQLAPSPQQTGPNTFPRKLSETGLFDSTKDLKPAPGLIPYSVNAQLWSDGALKERYIAIPGDAQIGYNEIEYPQPSPGAPRGWRFPDGTVMVKTFFLELEPGNPSSRRRLETRLLHFQKLAGTEEVGDQFWSGYTYVWNDEQTDAVLADATGLDQKFTIKDAKGGKREQAWHYPSRAECSMCHTVPAKFALGVNTLQLNKDHDYGGVVANQLRTWNHLGLFTKPLPDQPEMLPRLYDYNDEKIDLPQRARSYLHANCAICHMKWGGGNAEFLLLYTAPLADLGILNVKPAHGAFGINDARLLVPGQPERSLLYTRMKAAKIEDGRMPRIASSVVDEKGVKVVGDWIRAMSP